MNPPAHSRAVASVEPLETRIAPAAILTFTDHDTDIVTITSSKGTVADLQAALNDFAGDGASLTLGEVFKGANLSIVAGATDSDDARVNISFINAAGFDLGNVQIDGELNRIVAGDTNSRTAGVRSLEMFTFGVTDVTPGDAADQFDSEIIGALNSLTVHGDMQGASLKVFGSGFTPGTDPTYRDGRIGSVLIEGSLIGTARNSGGSIVTSGDITSVIINGDVLGLAGAGMAVTGQDQNAYISAGLKLGAVTVMGDIQGGDGFESGHITSGFGIRSLSARNILGGEGHDSGVVGSGGLIGRVEIAENVKGGGGDGSGAILSFANIQSVTIGMNLEGGAGFESGWVAAGGTLASVSIGQDLMGGAGVGSGQVLSREKINSVTIGRDLVGGSEFETGVIASLKGLGPILIKGSIFAGTGTRSGLISTQLDSYEGEEFIAAPIASVTVNGSIDGSEEIEGIAAAGSVRGAVSGPAGQNSAGILASGELGPVIVRGDVIGGVGDSSGSISSTGGIKSVTIGGSLVGGDGDGESFSFGSGTVRASGALGPVSIGGNLEGGDADFSGVIFSATKIGKVTIGGNIFGGNGYSSGMIESSNESASAADIGAVFIAGSVIGNNGERSGSIRSGGKIASVTIGDPKVPVENEEGVFDGIAPLLVSVPLGNGSMIGSFGDESGSISSGLSGSSFIENDGNLGPVKIKSDLKGGSGERSGRIFSGGRIASLTVGKDTFGSIIGGLGDQTDGYEDGQVYARGSITKVEIGGSLEGAEGDSTAQIRGRSIGSVIIDGSIYGRDGFGSGSIVAYSLDIGSVKVDNSIVAGSGERSGWIAAEGSIGTVETHFLSGSGISRARISAVDKITLVKIGDTASLADILAGYDTEGDPVNGDAQIGTVKVTGYTERGQHFGGNIIGVNIVAGVVPGSPTGFGTSADQAIAGASDTPRLYSKIGSVIIAGDVLQAPPQAGTSTHFGIVAQHIVSLNVGGSAKFLTPGAGNDPLSGGRLAGTATDTIYGEVSTSPPVVIDG